MIDNIHLQQHAQSPTVFEIVACLGNTASMLESSLRQIHTFGRFCNIYAHEC